MYMLIKLHTCGCVGSQTNISTRKYYTYMEITLPIVTALHYMWKNTTKSSAPEDGHKVARNMLSNL